jgi:DMSO/TMAO reductase YedYZ molybdopterin-dependent catalytic subunit
MALSAREVLAQGRSAPVLRARDGENYEYPFDVESFLTPADRFFVSSTFGVQRIDRGGWRMQIEGAVSRPFELNYDDLLRMPARTVTAVLEDAGNNRAFLSPAERGTQWGLGAVGCAQWTGVPLGEVLNRAGLRSEGVEVIFESTEAGEVRDEPRSPGRVNVARSIPIKKALSSEVLLAYKINGEDLPQHLGGPVRVVVPGWYGNSWIKWPQRAVVTGAPFEGYFQKFDGTVWERRNGFATLAPVTELQAKAQIARPVMYERVKMKNVIPVSGAAWAGESEIAAVEVSGDDGKTWQNARLLDSPAGAGP